MIIDNVSNHPELKLEYIAFRDNVERLIRRKVKVTKNLTAKDVKLKAREKAAKKAKKMLQADMLTTLDMEPSHPVYDWQDSSSEDEAEKQFGRSGLRVDSYDYKMSDIVGVRIFEKEVLSSAL